MALVESVIKLLLQKLGEPLIREAIREAIFLHGVGDQVELLMAEFRGMQSFLKDADAKQEGDERVKNWVRDVRDVAFNAEDVIDTFVLATAFRRSESVGCIKWCVFFLCDLIARHKVGSEIMRINNEIHKISERRLTYGIENIGQGAGTSSAGLSLQERRLTSPYFPEPDFVGFEKDLEALVARLTDDGELRRCVVSVVGMGGLGKTTLVKKVYNDTRVQTHFHSCEWVSISKDYGVRDLLTKIIKRYKQLPEEDLKSMDLFELKQEISVYLQAKRYLMVLDDIWTMEAWDALKDAFPDINNGSRVMLTTRNKDVALHADARSPPHEPLFLNDEQSWELFCRKTFPGQNGGCPRELEELGRQIMEKCYGLPLAIVVIGGLLSRTERGGWENVGKRISWQFVKGKVNIYSILSLSYMDLSHHLKACFLYLGNFPEDHEFRTKELIRLWAAEGFLEERGEEILEEVGEDYLEELIQRSMVQVSRRNSIGVVRSCRIHDLLRDLSISEAKEGMFLQVQGGNANDSCASRARRLAIHHDDLSEYTSLKSCTPHLRSVLIYTKGNAWLQKEQEKFLFGGFKLLRVLYLHGGEIKELPREIGELIHLRYLGCTGTELESLPSSIGNLSNLQTLFVESDSDEIKVPSTIGKMQQLRHLRVRHFPVKCLRWGVIEGHPRLDGITNLQTLSDVKAGKWMEGFLENLTNLRKLVIQVDVEKEGAYVEVFYKSIVKLDSLHSLRLYGKSKKLPVSTQFPANLTNLTLRKTCLEEDPLATLEKLKNLRILILHYDSYLGKEMACSAQGFPRLESLHLVELSELEEWRVEEGAMPCLLQLQIRNCWQLKKLPEGLQHVTTLRKLKLWNMADELKARLKENGGEDWDKIRHIPSIDIEY